VALSAADYGKRVERYPPKLQIDMRPHCTASARVTRAATRLPPRIRNRSV